MQTTLFTLFAREVLNAASSLYSVSQETCRTRVGRNTASRMIIYVGGTDMIELIT